MKNTCLIILLMLLVFPLSIFAQQTSPNNIACHAGFKADVTYGCSSFLAVQFTDQSVVPKGQSISRWNWDLGDGTISNEPNPRHQFGKPGLYTIKLVILTDQGWMDSIKRVDYIKVAGKVFVDLGNDTAISEGSSVELNAGNPGSTYSWNTGSNGQKIVVTEPGKYWVHVKKEACESYDSILIRTRSSLFPNFGFALEGNCLPIVAKFSDSSTSNGDNSVVRRVWDFGDGATSSQQNPEHIFTTNDTYNVRLTIWDLNGISVTHTQQVIVNAIQGPLVNLGNDTAVCEVEPLVLDAGNPGASYTWSTGDIFQSSVITNSGLIWVLVEQNGCVAADTIMVKVTPTLNPKFGYQVQKGICPATVAFTDSSQTCGVDIVQWSWDFGDGTSSSEQHPTHAFLQSGEFIVRMTIFDNIGNSMTRSKRVLIEPGTFHMNLGSDTVICFGDALTLMAGNDGVSYLWNTGETTPQITVQDDGDYWVRVDKGGCIGYDTINVKTVFPITPWFVSTQTGKCLPADVKFEDKCTTRCGQQIVQWRWDFGDGTTSQEQHPHHTYNRSDTFAVRLTIVTDKGMSVSKSKKIFIENTIPVVNAGNDITICRGESVQLDAGTDSAVYLWTPEISLNNNAIRRPIANPIETTTYLVAVTKCLTTVTDQVVVRVNTTEKPLITTNGKVLFSSNAFGYQWYKNNEIIRGANRRMYEPKGAGYYTVKVRNESGCQSLSDKFYYLPNHKKEWWTRDIRVKCTPNPSFGMVYIYLSHLPEKPVLVRVMDRFGQPLFTTTINDYSNLLNLTRLAKGYYVIELELGKERESIPLLIQ